MSNLRELDEWLAIHLFGFVWATYPSHRDRRSLLPQSMIEHGIRCADMTEKRNGDGLHAVPDYSTTGDGMMLVVDAMKAKHNGNLRLFWEMQEETYVAKFSLDVGIMGVGDTIPEAVARAAKAALEVEQ